MTGYCFPVFASEKGSKHDVLKRELKFQIKEKHDSRR